MCHVAAEAMESQDFGDKLQSRLRALEGKVCSEVEVPDAHL